jgi:hypothetical protein
MKVFTVIQVLRLRICADLLPFHCISWMVKVLNEAQVFYFWVTVYSHVNNFVPLL